MCKVKRFYSFQSFFIPQSNPQCKIDRYSLPVFFVFCTDDKPVVNHLTPRKYTISSSYERQIPSGKKALNEPAGLLLLFICGKMHPFTQWGFAVPVAFVQRLLVYRSLLRHLLVLLRLLLIGIILHRFSPLLIFGMGMNFAFCIL